MGIKKFYRPILGYDGKMIDGEGASIVESVNGQTGVVTITAADVGALPDDYTPTLTGQPASNISSGTFAEARIPNLNASKITAGTFSAARLPTGTAVADATDVVAQFNALLASLRAAGYIASLT